MFEKPFVLKKHFGVIFSQSLSDTFFFKIYSALIKLFEAKSR